MSGLTEEEIKARVETIMQFKISVVSGIEKGHIGKEEGIKVLAFLDGGEFFLDVLAKTNHPIFMIMKHLYTLYCHERSLEN